MYYRVQPILVLLSIATPVIWARHTRSGGLLVVVPSNVTKSWLFLEFVTHMGRTFQKFSWKNITLRTYCTHHSSTCRTDNPQRGLVPYDRRNQGGVLHAISLEKPLAWCAVCWPRLAGVFQSCACDAFLVFRHSRYELSTQNIVQVVLSVLHELLLYWTYTVRKHRKSQSIIFDRIVDRPTEVLD